MISQCMNEREQFKLMHVKKRFAQNNGVEYYDQVQTR